MIEQFLDAQSVALISVAVLIALAIRYRQTLAFSNPGDPSVAQVPGWPLVGNTFQVLAGKDRPLELFQEWQNKYGSGGKPFTVTFPPFGRVWMVNRPVYIEHVQKGQFSKYPKGRFFRSLFSDLLGEHGIFVADGQIWKEERKTASAVFSAQSFRTHITNALRKELAVLKDLYTNLAESGTAVRLQDIHFRFTLSTFGVFAFDDGFDALTSDPAKLKDPVAFADAFDYAQHVVDGRVLNPFWWILEPFTPGGARMRKAVKTIHDYSYNLIDKKRAERQSGGEKDKEQQNLLDLFMKLSDDRTVLQQTVLNFIIAGRDTTAQALSWWFWYIIAKPEVAEKIREEVEKVCGKSGPVDYDNMKDLVYTTACFYETLRLHGSVPKNMKFVNEDDVIPGDAAEGLPSFRVSKGDTIIFSDWVMGRTPEIWGPDCLEFKPERWIDEQGRVSKVSPFKFHAFNAGPRLCLGQLLATYEAISVVANVLRDFDVQFVTGGDKVPTYSNSLTLPIRDPYTVKFQKRQA